MGDVEVGLEREFSEDGRGRERRSKQSHWSGAKITLFQVTRIFLSYFPEGYSPEEAIECIILAILRINHLVPIWYSRISLSRCTEIKTTETQISNQCRPWEGNCVLFPSPQRLSLNGYAKAWKKFSVGWTDLCKSQHWAFQEKTKATK